MPTEQTITETYWTICYKKVWKLDIPYPCKKERTVTQYCYKFDWYWHMKISFICYYRGCEAGTLYAKWGICNSVFWYSYNTNYNTCTTDKFNQIGTC